MTGAPPERATIRGPHGVAAGLFLLVWLSVVWFGSNPFNPNTSTRLFAAISLVENHDAGIDEFQSLTIDKARFGGRTYMDKTPGMTLMALPGIALADRVTGDRARNHPSDLSSRDFARYLRLRLQVVVATTSAVLLAFAAVLLLDLATGITGSPGAGLATALAYALGTPAWGWSTTMFGHAPVGALLLIATWAVWRGTSGAREARRWRYPAMLGLCLGWAIVVELPAALPGAVLGLWAVWRARALLNRWTLAAIAAVAGIVALLPMLAYNKFAFGLWFKVGYQGVVGFEGMNHGLFGLTWPHPDILAQIVAGPRRGLLYVAPVLLLAPFGLARLIRTPATRDLGIMAAALSVTVLLYNASYFYWDGGYSTGPRHTTPACAFLALGIAPLWQAWGTRGRAGLAALLTLSIVVNLSIAATEITADDIVRFPLYDPVLRRMRALDVQSFPSDWWDWPAGQGFTLYLALALPLLWFLWRAADLSERTLTQREAAARHD